MQQARANLKKHWGFDDFRPGQDEVVGAVLAGKPTLVLFPTGGGKSLCYQVPATVLEGLTVVISPLVALMQDQVFQLKERGVSATFINSTISRQKVEQRLINARNGMYKLLYCAPERMETELWQNMLPELAVSLVAVDEAHCISEWGHDFRPVYRKIPEMMAPAGNDIRWLALTATATPEVRRDIVEALCLPSPEIISRGFDRPNLHWWVVEEEQKKRRLGEIVRRASGSSGLVYAGTRAACEALARELSRQGHPAEAYHAGLTPDQRESIQDRWIDGRLPLVVATNAFGMGIDKPDCRFVVHFDMPTSMEAYYQEAGRAGRDGKESYPILLSRKADFKAARKNIMDSWPDRRQLKAVYNAVCDHWDLAAGSMMDEMRKIDLDQVTLRSGLSRRLVWSGLRVLDQTDVIRLARIHEPQVGIQFIPSREGLQDRLSRMDKVRKRDFTDQLARLMGPEVHRQMVYLDERQIRTRLQLSSRLLENGLEVLASEGLLSYEIIRDEPVAKIMEGRYQKFRISEEEIIRHRDRLLKKLEFMIGYVQTRECRSRYIRHYFGEERVPERCGKCDRCKQGEGDRGVHATVRPDDIEMVRSLLEEEPMSFETLRTRTRWKRRHLNSVLAHMMREEEVSQARDEQAAYSIRS
ncbi:RecQ family ATP-dependent DNA helicase [Balneolales bacterium ANBcel1]|nr:RecQ family ATP-dependent DNA helicase [Balneolales bacterium ANBcel1]